MAEPVADTARARVRFRLDATHGSNQGGDVIGDNAEEMLAELASRYGKRLTDAVVVSAIDRT